MAEKNSYTRGSLHAIHRLNRIHFLTNIRLMKIAPYHPEKFERKGENPRHMVLAICQGGSA
jgi:hypothetical protein